MGCDGDGEREVGVVEGVGGGQTVHHQREREKRGIIILVVVMMISRRMWLGAQLAIGK